MLVFALPGIALGALHFSNKSPQGSLLSQREGCISVEERGPLCRQLACEQSKAVQLEKQKPGEEGPLRAGKALFPARAFGGFRGRGSELVVALSRILFHTKRAVETLHSGRALWA